MKWAKKLVEDYISNNLEKTDPKPEYEIYTSHEEPYEWSPVVLTRQM